MKNLYEVLRVKEQKVSELRREMEALRFVIGLFDQEEGMDASPTKTAGGPDAVYLLTSSGRLEVVVGGAPRLQFAGRMCMAVEVMRVGNEFHIFVPTPPPSGSSWHLEEGAA